MGEPINISCALAACLSVKRGNVQVRALTSGGPDLMVPTASAPSAGVRHALDQTEALSQGALLRLGPESWPFRGLPRNRTDRAAHK